MAKSKRIRKKDIKYYAVAFVIVLLLGFFSRNEKNTNDSNNPDSVVEEQQNELLTSEVDSSEEMKVHFIDVGQGLCILVQLGDDVLIYDGGEHDTSSFVVAYLKELGLTEIDYMISSHYDSDHVSGLIGCLYAFDVKNVICSDYVHDSSTYESFIKAVEAEGVTAQHPKVGMEYAFGDAKITILAPEEIGNDSNTNSVAIKLSYGESDFIFTGDADYKSEKRMIASGIDLDCDVLSLGHHGSSSSNSSAFLATTTPEYAVISCGADNAYGHPHEEVVELLEAMEIDVFRSDVQGTVIAISDGNTITWSEAPCNDYTDGD